jgi:4-amino-4-deoxy-L-arabinose transferase-like glycosyltransferase
MIVKYKYHILLILVFIVGLFFRLRVEDPLFYGDPFVYYTKAVEIYKTGNYSPMVWPMGYPLILASSFYFLGMSIHSAHVITAVFGSLTVFPVYFLAKEFFTKKIAILSAFLIAITPLHILMSAGLWSDAPAAFFLTLSIYFLVRYNKTEYPPNLYLYVTFVTFSILIRWNNIIFLLFAFIYLIYTKKDIFFVVRKKEVYTALLICVIILTPQLIYNTNHFGGPFNTLYLNTDYEKFSWHYLFGETPDGSYPTIVAYGYTILFWTFDFGSPFHLLAKSTFISPTLTIFSLIGFLILYRSKKYSEFLLFSFWIILTIIPLLFWHQTHLWQTSRFLLSIHPPAIIVGVYGIFELTKKIGQKLSSLTSLKSDSLNTILNICIILIIITPMITVSVLVKPPPEDSFGKEIQTHLESLANKYVIFSVERHEAFKDAHVWIKMHRSNDTLVLGGHDDIRDEFFAGDMLPLNTSLEQLKEKMEKANDCYIIVYTRANDGIDIPDNIKSIINNYNYSLVKSFDTHFRGENWDIYYRGGGERT